MSHSFGKATWDPETLFVEADRKEEEGDFEAAFVRLLAAAKQGHAGSQINLGNYYADGRGVKKNLRQAARWYKEAFRQGDATGAFNLGLDRLHSGRTRAAVSWFAKAAKADHGGAHIELAKSYLAKLKGRERAVELLQQALRLSRANLSLDERDEAASLLRSLMRREV